MAVETDVRACALLADQSIAAAYSTPKIEREGSRSTSANGRILSRERRPKDSIWPFCAQGPVVVAGLG